MASNQPLNILTNELTQFDYVAERIANTFETLVGQLRERKNALMKKPEELKESYITTETTHRAAIKELERVRQQMLDESIKVNANYKVQQEVIEVYQREMTQKETPTRLPQPSFSCETLSQLQSLIDQFGDLIDTFDFSTKTQPVLAIGKHGKNQNEFDAAGLSLDDSNKCLYIADYFNKRIQVVSIEGKFVNIFGQDILKGPYGILVTAESVLVTDKTLNALLKFSKKDYKLLKSIDSEGGEGELNQPRGLCTGPNGEVYVADSSNNRVSVFSQDLHVIKYIGTHQLIGPRDVKLTTNKIVILDSSPTCIHLYSKTGELLSSIISNRQHGMVYLPRFFCLDTSGNIIVSDYGRHEIKIFSPPNQLMHTIGRKGHKRGELFQPRGICVSQLGTIYVISENKNFCLQSF